VNRKLHEACNFSGFIKIEGLLEVTGSHVHCKGKGFPYSLPSVGPGADAGVQAVSPQAAISHPPSGRLPLLSARPAVTFPAAEHHRPLAGPSYTAW